MKAILAITTLLILTAGSAQADVLTITAPGAKNEFVTRYSLDSFKIASDSLRLNGQGVVSNGTIEINEGSNELRITLNRRTSCPTGMMCAAVMPAPTIITLPIRGIHSNPCGGITIIAERNLQLVDGGLLRVEVQDANGGFNSCGGNADDITFVKRVKVLVSERGLRDRVDALSVFSGFPLSQ